MNNILNFSQFNLNENNNFETQYRKWKRDNVTYRGISTDSVDGENGGMAMLGQGLYSVPASNKKMARTYGKLAMLVNAKPKNPKVCNTLNEWEIWFQRNVVFPISKAKGKDYPDARDVNSISEEMMKLGYDGVIIKGREMVNYKPENVRYYYNERQLEIHFEDNVYAENVSERKSYNDYPYHIHYRDALGMTNAQGGNSVEKLITIAQELGLKEYAIFKKGYHSTTQDEYLIKWYADIDNNTYWSNTAKKYPELYNKAINPYHKSLALRTLGKTGVFESKDFDICIELYFEIFNMPEEVENLEKYNLNVEIRSEKQKGLNGCYVNFIGTKNDIRQYLIDVIGYDDFATDDMLSKFSKTYLVSNKLKDYNKSGVFENSSKQFEFSIQIDWSSDFENVKYFKSKAFLNKVKMYNLKSKLIKEEGPGGWPIIELRSSHKQDIIDFLKYEYDLNNQPNEASEFFNEFGETHIKSKKLKAFNDKTGILD